MLKKILSLCFAILFLLTFIPSVFADDEDYTYETTPIKYLKSYKEWEEVRDEYAPISGDLRQDILTVARSQIGNCASTTRTKYVDGYGTKHWTIYGDFMGSPYCEWCDAFASFCVYYGGAGDYPLEISCTRHELALKKSGFWRNWNQYIPRPGDIVFLALSKDGIGSSHVAIVERVVAKKGDKKAYLVTIEGNVSVSNGNGCTGVTRCVRSFDDVVGYGTYEKGDALEQKFTPRHDGNPGGDVNDAYSKTLPPVKDVLLFIGIENTPYYYFWFPEEKPMQISDSQNQDDNEGQNDDIEQGQQIQSTVLPSDSIAPEKTEKDNGKQASNQPRKLQLKTLFSKILKSE